MVLCDRDLSSLEMTSSNTVRKATSLGTEIDNHLRWVIKSYSAKVGQLRRMSYLPIKVKEEIYFKTIILTMTYGIIVWGTCSKSLMKDIERMHIQAVKIIHNLPKHISDEDALEAKKWDKISTKERFYPRCTKYSMVNSQKYSDPQDNKHDKERNCFTILQCTKEIG